MKSDRFWNPQSADPRWELLIKLVQKQWKHWFSVFSVKTPSGKSVVTLPLLSVYFLEKWLQTDRPHTRVRTGPLRAWEIETHESVPPVKWRPRSGRKFWECLAAKRPIFYYLLLKRAFLVYLQLEIFNLPYPENINLPCHEISIYSALRIQSTVPENFNLSYIIIISREFQSTVPYGMRHT